MSKIIDSHPFNPEWKMGILKDESESLSDSHYISTYYKSLKIKPDKFNINKTKKLKLKHYVNTKTYEFYL